MSVLKRISVSTTPTTSSMRLCFADNLLSISVSSPDIGEAVDTIAIKYDATKTSEAALKAAIEKLGYKIIEGEDHHHHHN